MWSELELEKMPFRSILIDLPGHGNSSLEQKELDLDKPSIIACAKSIITCLKSLAVENFDLVGHSLGGYVAIEVHKTLKLKTKLCLLNSNFWEDDEQKKLDRNRVIEVVKQNKSFFIKEAIPNLFLEKFRTSEFVNDLIKEASHIQSEAIIYYSCAMRDRKTNENYIKKHKNNTFILQGNEDRIVAKEKMIGYKDLFINILNSAGHMAHFENSKEVNTFLRNF